MRCILLDKWGAKYFVKALRDKGLRGESVNLHNIMRLCEGEEHLGSLSSYTKQRGSPFPTARRIDPSLLQMPELAGHSLATDLTKRKQWHSILNKETHIPLHSLPRDRGLSTFSSQMSDRSFSHIPAPIFKKMSGLINTLFPE